MTPDTEIPPELLQHLLKTEGIEKTLRLYTDRYNAITERHKATVEGWKNGFDAVIDFAELAIKSLLLLCGGAAVALLSFAGSRGATSQVSLDAYANAVMLFGGAAAGAVTTAGLSYLAQTCFNAHAQGWEPFGEKLRYAAIVIWFGSLAAFGYGSWTASWAIQLSKWETTVQSEPVAQPAKPH